MKFFLRLSPKEKVGYEIYFDVLVGAGKLNEAYMLARQHGDAGRGSQVIDKLIESHDREYHTSVISDLRKLRQRDKMGGIAGMSEIFIRAEDLDQLIAYSSEQGQKNIAERESKEVYVGSRISTPIAVSAVSVGVISLFVLGWLAYSHLKPKQQINPQSAIVQIDAKGGSSNIIEKRTLYNIIKSVSEAKKPLSYEDRLEIIRILGAKYGIAPTPSYFYGVSFEIWNPKKASAEEKKAYEQVKQEYSKSYVKAPPTLADLLNRVVVRTGNIPNDDHAVKEIVNGFFLMNYFVEVDPKDIEVVRNPDGTLKDIEYVPAAKRIKEILVSKPRHVLWLVGQKVPVPLEYMQPR